MEIRKLTLDDPTFPAVLREIPTPPQQIYVLGELESLLARPRLGVVGSRRPTGYGRQATTQLVKDSVRHGVVIVSGLAFGIDAVAHQATLNNSGQTIAVLASGLSNITPASHTNLANEIIASGGALVSEYPPNTTPHRHYYIARNRLIAGLSQTLLVTQAAIDSGTRHTAQFTLDQNKTVMAIPGSIYDPLSAGTNQLIKDYALPVTEVEDILLQLSVVPLKQEQLALVNATPAELAILEALRTGVKDTEQLLAASKLGISTFNQTLTLLELDERITYLESGEWGLS